MACLHQIFRGKNKLNVFPKGWGNCNKCIPDKKNKECPGYVGVKLIVVEVCQSKPKPFPPC